jgi:hypothetical protein
MQQLPKIKGLGRAHSNMPRRLKTARKATARKSKAKRQSRTPARSRAGKADAVEAMIAAGAQALALPLAAAWRGGVRFNLQLILSHAARVEEFPLPDDSEPAPVFHA